MTANLKIDEKKLKPFPCFGDESMIIFFVLDVK